MSNGQSTSSILRAEHISRVYPDGEVTALVDVTLEILRGEYVAIMGPSGSGKSTLLNLLGALDRPSEGEVYFENEAMSRCPRLDRIRSQKIGFVFQSFYLLPTLTALENVQIPMFECRTTSRQREDRARELLAAVGLSHRERHLPSQLSVGQRQRVAIARALANSPPLLLADEPTGNLDSRAGADVLALFDQLQQERGLTLVVITHSQEVADRAGRVLHILDGRLLPSAGVH
jgi:putative ABC transport system ATP-binding protein